MSVDRQLFRMDSNFKEKNGHGGASGFKKTRLKCFEIGILHIICMFINGREEIMKRNLDDGEIAVWKLYSYYALDSLN